MLIRLMGVWAGPMHDLSAAWLLAGDTDVDAHSAPGYAAVSQSESELSGEVAIWTSAARIRMLIRLMGVWAGPMHDLSAAWLLAGDTDVDAHSAPGYHLSVSHCIPE